MERRISKQELMKLYGVDRSTIENWKENYNYRNNIHLQCF